MTTNIREDVRKMVATVFTMPVDEVTDSASFIDDLKGDSLDRVELALAVETEFDIEVRDSDLEGITTVGEFLDYAVQQHEEKKA